MNNFVIHPFDPSKICVRGSEFIIAYFYVFSICLLFGNLERFWHTMPHVKIRPSFKMNRSSTLVKKYRNTHAVYHQQVACKFTYHSCTICFLQLFVYHCIYGTYIHNQSHQLASNINTHDLLVYQAYVVSYYYII